MTRFLTLLCVAVVAMLFANQAQAQFNNLPADTNVVPAQPKEVGEPGPTLKDPVTQQWKTGVIIRAIGGPCAGLSGTFPIPLDWPEQQVKLADQQATPHFSRVSYRSTEDVLKQALFTIPLIQANDMARMELTFDVINYIQVAPTETSGYVVPKSVPTAMRKFLGPSPYIESTNIKFKNLAKEATESRQTAWEQVEMLYDTVREKVKYERSPTGRFVGAIGAINNGQADREDLNSAFVAACRAMKVPARMVWIPDSCYAEFYLENEEGKGAWFPAKLEGDKQFGGLEDRKPILQKGDNLRVPENKDAQRFVAEFLTGKGRAGGRPDVEFMRRLEGLP